MSSRFLDSTAENAINSKITGRSHERKRSISERRSYCANSDLFSSKTHVFCTRKMTESDFKRQGNYFDSITREEK